MIYDLEEKQFNFIGNKEQRNPGLPLLFFACKIKRYKKMGRRMFSPQIVESDAFLDMPLSSQALYFHLGMHADDDGFVNPKRIVRALGVSEDDLKILLVKRFILPFENGVIVIKHWRINNLLRKDWYKPTLYQEQLKLLKIKDNGAYTELCKDQNPQIPQTLTSSLTQFNSIQLNSENSERDTLSASLSLTKASPSLSSSKKKQKNKPFSYKEKIEIMTRDGKHNKLLAYYLQLKNWVFENEKQYKTFYTRNIKTARLLWDSGYTENQIIATMDYCDKKFKDISWTLETVLKKLAEANG